MRLFAHRLMFRSRDNVVMHLKGSRCSSTCFDSGNLRSETAWWLLVVVTSCLFIGMPTGVHADDQSLLVVEVPLNMDGPFPVVSAEFLGKPYSFLFDTGAATTDVDRTFRPQLGIPLVVPAEFQEMARRVNREVYGDQVVVLGDQRFYSGIGISSIDTPDSMIGTEVAGTLGMDCFEDYAIEFDPDQEMFRVYDHVPEHIKNASESFPLMTKERDYRCWVELPLPNVGAQHLLIDTGDDGSVSLREETFDSLVQTQNIGDCFLTPTTSADGFNKVVTGKLNQFNVGQFQHDHLNVKRSRKSSGISTLGWDYLRRYIAVLDLVLCHS